MNFSEWLKLQEMPIKAMNFLPPENWPEINGGKKKPGWGYNKADRGILTNEPGRAKIIKKWSNTKTEFVFYFVRSEEAAKHLNVGEVTSEWIQKNLNVTVEPKEETVQVIFTQNTGGEKIPMTAWMIAHRMGHAIRRTRGWQEFTGTLQQELAYLMKDVYAKSIQRSSSRDSNGDISYSINEPQSRRAMLHLARNIGTMKSARNSSLFSYDEFEYELLAQYLITGEITFNSLKQTLVKGAFGRPGIFAHVKPEELEEYSDSLQSIARGAEYHLDWAVTAMEGKLFVM